MDLSIGIITLNARYIHSSLSLRYLRNAAHRAAGFGNTWIQEFIIHQPTWKIAAPDSPQTTRHFGNRRLHLEPGAELRVDRAAQKAKTRQLKIVARRAGSLLRNRIFGCNFTVLSREREKKNGWSTCNYASGAEKFLHAGSRLRVGTVYGDRPAGPRHPPYHRRRPAAALKNRIAYLETSQRLPLSVLVLPVRSG